MADKKIPEFPEKTTLESTDVLLLTDTVSGTSKKVSGNNLGTAIDKGSLSSELISADADNQIVQGTDDLLYVPASGGGGTNTPNFRATMSATQIIGVTTYAKIEFDTETFDSDGDYDPTTNFRFTPTVAGKYQVTITAEVQVSNMTDLRLSLYKNGVTEIQQDKTRPSNGVTSRYNMIVSDIVEMNGTTDYIEAYAYANGTGNPSVQHERNSATASWFSAYLLSE